MRKKYIYIIILHFMLFTSCNKYLDVQEFGEILPKTTEDYSALINTQLKNIEGNRDLYIIGAYEINIRNESIADNLNANIQLRNGLKLFYVGDCIDELAFRYGNIYKTIKDFNIVLDNIPEKESALSKKILAASYAMRAQCYFNLLREFCEPLEGRDPSAVIGLPIVSSFNLEYKPSRSSFKETVEFITSDLKKAIDLNLKDEMYLFTPDICKAILARTYFWAGDWNNAAVFAEDILNKYPLVEGELYKNMIQAETEKLGNVLIRSYTKASPVATNNYNREMKKTQSRPVSLSLVNLFKEKERDIRYTFFFDKKFLNTKGTMATIRSAEMCLILAECYAHLGNEAKSLSYLNLLRSKRISDYTPYEMNTLPSVDKSDLIKVDATRKTLTPLMSAILNERRKELFMEGDRWFELKRNCRPKMWIALDWRKYVTEKFLYNSPIPKMEILANTNITQNAGYTNE